MLPHVMRHGTDDSPGRGVQARCRAMEADGALSASVLVGFPSADTEYAGAGPGVVLDTGKVQIVVICNRVESRDLAAFSAVGIAPDPALCHAQEPRALARRAEVIGACGGGMRRDRRVHVGLRGARVQEGQAADLPAECALTRWAAACVEPNQFMYDLASSPGLGRPAMVHRLLQLLNRWCAFFGSRPAARHIRRMTGKAPIEK